MKLHSKSYETFYINYSYLLLSFFNLVANNHYGFRLQGRSDVGESSTTLLLNDRKPFPLNKDLIIGLKLEVREGPVEGCIMYMRSNTGK